MRLGEMPLMQIEEWWATMPRITKACFVFSLGSTLAVTAGAITPLHLWLDWDNIYHNFHIWRLVTNFFFFGKFGMGFIFSMMLLYVCGSVLVWCVCVVCVCFDGCSLLRSCDVVSRCQNFRGLEEEFYASARGQAEMTWMLMLGMSVFLVPLCSCVCVCVCAREWHSSPNFSLLLQITVDWLDVGVSLHGPLFSLLRVVHL
jgi:hypothetical protein